MEYREYEPSERLSPFIKYHWSLDSAAQDMPHERERIFPDGCLEMIFNYADVFTKFDENGIARTQHFNIIHGQIRRFIELEGTGKVGMLSVRFLPAGLRPFVHFDVDSITDSALAIYEAWPDGQDLENRITDCATNAQRIALIEDFLLSKLDHSKFDATVDACARLISDTGGSLSIDDLAERFHVGTRQLERRFVKSVGLTQKAYSRIVRFNRALQLIEKQDFRTFTDVAYDGGFYDQAHFIRDFKDLTGLNPKQYFSENLEMAKYFNLD